MEIVTQGGHCDGGHFDGGHFPRWPRIHQFRPTLIKLGLIARIRLILPVNISVLKMLTSTLNVAGQPCLVIMHCDITR